MKPTFPPGHKPLVVLQEGTFSCANCEYVDAEKHVCNNRYYQKYFGTDKLPEGDLNLMCSDWFEAK